MRVLFVTDWPSTAGGVESSVSLAAAGLRRVGDDVRLLTSTAGSGDAQADYRAFGTNSALPNVLLQVANPSAMHALRAALREFRPDVVHVSMFEMHLSPAAILAMPRVPLVLSVMYYKPICPNGLKLLPDGSLCSVRQGRVCWRGGCTGFAHWLRDRPRYRLIRAAIDRASAVLTCSVWMQRSLAEAGIESEVWSLPIVLPGPRFERVPHDRPLFVYVGRLVREKGVDVLLRAIAALRACGVDAHVRVVGDGPLADELGRLARQLGIASVVDWRGFVAPDDVGAELADAWALVAPSVWAEPFGLVAPEAIARGVPVVASAAGGLAETVEDGVSGLLVANGEVGALADSLLAVAERRAFPNLTVPPAVVESIRRRHDPDRCVGDLRAALQRVAFADPAVPA